MRFLFVLTLAVQLWAANNVTVSGQTGTSTLPNSAPFNGTMGDFQFIARLTNPSGFCTAATLSNIAAVTLSDNATNFGISCRNGVADSIRFTPALDLLTDDDGIGVSMVGRTDVWIKFRRDLGNSRWTVETINGDRTGYTIHTLTVATPNARSFGLGNLLRFGGSGASFRVSNFRWYQGAGVSGEANMPTADPEAGTPIVAYTFNGNSTASGTYGSTVSWSPNTVSYSNTVPSYPPTCNAGRVMATVGSPTNFNAGGYGPTMRAGVANTILGGGVQNTGDPGSATYFWQQLTGPSALAWSSRTSAITSVSGAINTTYASAAYTLQLTVTDSLSNKTTCNAVYGAVATDSSDRVILPDSRLQTIMGQPTRWGASIYPYMDERLLDWWEQRLVGTWNTTLARPWETALPGTISRSADGATITGTGTNFQVDFCGGDTTPDNQFVIWYGSAPVLRRALVISSCNSATSITISNGGSREKIEGPGIVSGLSYSVNTEAATGAWLNALSGTLSAPYYDIGLRMYQFGLRSGIPNVMTWARNVVDAYWAQPAIGQAQSCYVTVELGCGPPRYFAMLGIVVRAIDDDLVGGVDGASYKWDGLAGYLAYLKAYRVLFGFGSVVSGDLREDGYTLMQVALGARYLPSRLSAAKTDAQAELPGYFDKWVGWAQTTGTEKHWVNYVSGNSPWNGGAAGTVSLINGSTTVTGSGTDFDGSVSIGHAFRAMTTCFNYDTSYLTVGYHVTAIGSDLSMTISPAWQGSNVSGLCYQTGERVGQGTQPFMQTIALIGIRHAKVSFDASGDTTRSGQAATMLTYGTNWLANKAYTGPTDRGVYYGLYFTTCQPPVTLASNPECLGGATADRRIYAADTIAAFMAEYLISGDNNLKTVADLFMGGNWDSTVPNYYADFNNPSGGYWIAEKQAFLNLSMGLGRHQSWQGDRLGMMPGPNAVVKSIKARLADVTGAVDIVVDFRAADSTVTTSSPCTGAACSFSTDGRQNYQYRVRYRNGSAVTIATGQYAPVN